MTEVIRCRSQKSPNCYGVERDEDHPARTVTSIYGPDGSMAEDGTWDGETIVCDACYIAIGQPSVDVLDPRAPFFGSQIEGGKGSETPSLRNFAEDLPEDESVGQRNLSEDLSQGGD